MDADEEVNGRGWEMVGEGPTSALYDDGDFSVFPPSLHEGLTPTLTLVSPSPSTSSSLESLEENKDEKEEEDEELVVVSHVSRTPISGSARRLVGSAIELIRSKLDDLRGGGCNGGAVWSFAALAGFAGVLMYIRRRHRREKGLLLLLILEKDERINQLMDQIVKMSKLIAATYKVPVVKRT